MARRPRWWWRALRWTALAVLAALLLVAAWQALTWPDVAALAASNPETTAFIDAYRKRESRAGREPRLQWRWVPSSRISPELKHAVLVAEDIDFYSHDGFDTFELKEAVRDAWEEGKPLRGASTLSQQTVKNLWLSPSRNPLRKLKETLLTVQLERELGKARILEIYLNVAELGPGVYGAEAAARHYFGAPAAALTRRQAAELAASLSRPATWHPGVERRGYRRRVEVIRTRMEKTQWLRREIDANAANRPKTAK
jgi:monofunctional biosynthetic peptidoglycan transglycosylase